MYGAGAEKMLLIITEKGSRVAQAIDKSTGRGSSIAQIQGSYTGQNKQLVISAMSKNQIFLAKKAVRDTDASSFVMVSSADRVFGEGFNETEE